MIDIPIYLAFVAAALFIIATPGPSVLFVVARSIHLGTRGGILSVAGIALGALCHAVAVSLGLAGIVDAHPQAFVVIKNMGCIYLVYLGLNTWFSKPAKNVPARDREESWKRILVQGWLVELLNPKTALFFIAFLPQFTDPPKGNAGLQLISLGITFVVLGLFSDSIYALLSGRAAILLKRSTAFTRVEKYVSGSVYCGLGFSGLLYKIPGKLLSHSG